MLHSNELQQWISATQYSSNTTFH